MQTSDVLEKIDSYYSNALREHGATPRGVDWNSTEAQTIRFGQVTKIADGADAYSINDFGCGYGALLDSLDSRVRSYTGYDVSEAMIAEANRLYAADGRTFTTHLEDVGPADFSVASGIFSVKMDVTDEAWETYIFETLDAMAERSIAGFSFNMLTKYSDADRMRDNLYYADPHRFFEHCHARFSRNVALLHDYDLYEFTLLVRLKVAR